MKKKKNNHQNQKGFKEKEIVKEMESSYLDYAMSVIISRALPDVRDGLKPVQRRILYTMYEDRLLSTSRFKKCATVVGNTMARYHPHGDSPIYGALVRMAQNFSLRYPLVWGQGNMGSIDDPSEYAAMRYTECRLSPVGQELLRDIEKETVDFRENYDGSRKEPVVLPSPLPNLLLNGSMGIAVGMATNIPLHNLRELSDALIYLLDHPQATTRDLFRFIQGPDFPTGGIIFDKEAIISAYSQGRGSIVIRGRAEIGEGKRGFQIIISEIPFGVQKSILLQQIARLIEEQKIKGVRDLRDESDQEGLRIVIDLRPNSYPKKVLNQLYKWTNLQTSFHLNMLALIDGIQPQVLSLVEALKYFLLHRREVVYRRTKFDLQKAKERIHILEGLVKALKKIDAVIKTIKASKDRPSAQKNLIKKFKLTKIQANAILEMRLSSLARLEREKVNKELKELQAKAKELTAILKSNKKIKAIIKKEIEEYKKLFGDERKTVVFDQKIDQFKEIDLIPKEETVIILTREGFIKRMNPSVYRVQKRGGKGMIGAKPKEEDIVDQIISANTHDYLLFFTVSGKVFKVRAFEIPEVKRTAKGKALVKFLEIGSKEKVLKCFPLNPETENQYIIMVTENGFIKKTRLNDFKNVRRTGLIAIKLKEGDFLQDVDISSGNDEILLVSSKGQAIRFDEKEVRPMGRVSQGVRAIRLKKGDRVVGVEVIKEKKRKPMYLLTVSEAGYGKRTLLKEYRKQKRGGLGIKAAKLSPKTGSLVSTRILKGKEKYLLLVSQKGQVIKVKISSVSKLGRVSQGVRLMRLDQDDKVSSLAIV